MQHCAYCDDAVPGTTKPTPIPDEGLRYFCDEGCVAQHCIRQWKARKNFQGWRTSKKGNWFRTTADLIATVYKRADGLFGFVISERVEEGEKEHDPSVFSPDTFTDPEAARMDVDDVLGVEWKGSGYGTEESPAIPEHDLPPNTLCEACTAHLYSPIVVGSDHGVECYFCSVKCSLLPKSAWRT